MNATLYVAQIYSTLQEKDQAVELAEVEGKKDLGIFISNDLKV